MTQATRAKGDRSCPVCQAAMTVAKKGLIQIDVCEQHGVWLDEGELDVIAQRIEQRERGKRRLEVQRARQEGKVSGVFFGSLALLFD